MLSIVQDSSIAFGEDVKSIADMPYTLSFVVRKRMQINSWLELPREKRPPESIWDKPAELREWFDRVFDTKAQTDFNIGYNDDEVE